MVEWRDVPGYEGLYAVSDDGQVRSLGRWTAYVNGGNRYFPSMNLKCPLDSTGYPHVRLTKDRRGVTFRVHQLMAMAFLDKSPEDTQVRHLNDCRSDNRLVNLKWGTAAENMSDKFRNGYVQERPKRCKRDHPLTGPNERVKPDGRRNCKECGRAYSYIRKLNPDSKPTEEQFEDFFKEHGYKWLN